MKISVIIPYKRDEETAELAGRCLESVMNQDFDIIYLVDFDGEGVSVTRNKGIAQALHNGADYITFLDADDTYTPDAYEQILAAIEEEPQEQIIQLNHYLMRPDGTTRVRFFNRRATYYLDSLPQFWVGVWNKVYKADLIRDIRFKEGMSYGEDELFNLECLAKARQIYCSEKMAVIHHKDNPASLSKTATVKDLMDEQEALCEIVRRSYDAKDFCMCEAVRQRQSVLWTNSTYLKVFSEVHNNI